MSEVTCSFCGLETTTGGVIARNGRRICRTCLDTCARLPITPANVRLDTCPAWGDVPPEIREVVACALIPEIERVERNFVRANEHRLDVLVVRMSTALTIFCEAVSALLRWPIAGDWTGAEPGHREPIFATLIKAAYTAQGEAAQCAAHGLLVLADRHRRFERAYLSAAVALGWTGPTAPR